MHYYKRLKEAREATKKSQTEIAGILKMKQPQYQRYETGERDTPTQVLRTLAEYYKVSTDYLLGMTDEKKQPPKSKEN